MFSRVFGSVHSFVPFAKATKFATVLGALSSNNRTTISPMLVFKVAYSRLFFSWAWTLNPHKAAMINAAGKIIFRIFCSSLLPQFRHDFVDEAQVHVLRSLALGLDVRAM